MPAPFHLRFNLDLPTHEAQKKFINRIENEVRKIAADFERALRDGAAHTLNPLMIAVESTLGELHDSYVHDEISFISAWRRVVKNDFLSCLRAFEALYQYVSQHNAGGKRLLESGIETVFSLSETELGISWKDGIFIRAGAKLLDENLVNAPLHWLGDPVYRTVLIPFEKGLKHFLEGEKESERLADAISFVRRGQTSTTQLFSKVKTGQAFQCLTIRHHCP
jgi:hypothetical protein